MMWQELMNKHINVFLDSDVLIDGFLVNAEGDFCKVIELDNNVVFFRKDNVTLARIINVAQVIDKPIEKPLMFQIAKPRKVGLNANNDCFLGDDEDDFYVGLPNTTASDFSVNMSAGPAIGPEFIRSTPREKDDINNENK